MAYKDYSDARDFYASLEWRRASHIFTVVKLYYANCNPKRRFSGVLYNTLMEIADKEYTADQAIEALRHLMVPGTYGWESQTHGKHWRNLLEARPEYRHLKPTIEGEP